MEGFGQGSVLLRQKGRQGGQQRSVVQSGWEGREQPDVVPSCDTKRVHAPGLSYNIALFKLFNSQVAQAVRASEAQRSLIGAVL